MSSLPLDDPAKRTPHDGWQADQHCQGIADQHDPSLGLVDFLVEIPDRAQVQHPLRPRGFVRMHGEHLRLQVEHEPVMRQDAVLDAIHFEPVAGPESNPVDREWHEAEPQECLRKGNSRHRHAAARQDEAPAAGLPAQREEGEARNHDDGYCIPLARHRETERDARQRQPPSAGLRFAHGSSQLPECRCQRRNHEDVEHGDARMDEEVESRRKEDARRDRGKPAERCEPYGAHSGEQGKHPGDRGENAPAPRIITQDGYSQRDHLLAEQGMLAVVELLQHEQLARGGHVMHFVEVRSARDCEVPKDEQPEAEGQRYAPAKRIQRLLGCAHHRVTD